MEDVDRLAKAPWTSSFSGYSHLAGLDMNERENRELKDKIEVLTLEGANDKREIEHLRKEVFDLRDRNDLTKIAKELFEKAKRWVWKPIKEVSPVFAIVHAIICLLF